MTKSKTSGLADSPGAPLGMFSEPVEKFAEIYGSSKVSQGRMFVVCVLMGFVSMVAVGGMIALSNKSTAIPFYVPVNDEGGVRNAPVRMENIRPNQAVIKAELAKFITNVFTIDPVLTPKYFKAANVMTSGLATTQFTEFRNSENIAVRLSKEPDLTRAVVVGSVDNSQPGIAFAFLTTTEARGAVNGTVIAKWRVTLKYELQPPKSEEEILANPLGLYVTSLNITKEGQQ